MIGGKRSDGVDDPKSLHFELNLDNLDTDMIIKLDSDGNLRYTMDCDMLSTISNDDCDLLHLDSVEERGYGKFCKFGNGYDADNERF